METEEAQEVALQFLEAFPADGFATTQDLVAAALLWGENLGVRKMRVIATAALNDARDRMFS